MEPVQLAEITEHLTTLLATGYCSVAQAVEVVLGVFEDDQPDAREIETMASQAAAARAAQLVGWPATTDCDRLSAAFVALDAAGIMASENFTDCQACGTDAMHDELMGARAKGQQPRGYVYFHQQDTSVAAAGGPLRLAFASIDGDLAKGLVIGREIVAQLRRVGLEVDWPDAVERRIRVLLEWKKRAVSGSPSWLLGHAV